MKKEQREFSVEPLTDDQTIALLVRSIVIMYPGYIHQEVRAAIQSILDRANDHQDALQEDLLLDPIFFDLVIQELRSTHE